MVIRHVRLLRQLRIPRRLHVVEHEGDELQGLIVLRRFLHRLVRRARRRLLGRLARTEEREEVFSEEEAEDEEDDEPAAADRPAAETETSARAAALFDVGANSTRCPAHGEVISTSEAKRQATGHRPQAANPRDPCFPVACRLWPVALYRSRNILFFGHFATMNEDDYMKEIAEILSLP